MIAALLLSILGVPWETILADYTLSNLHYDKIRLGIDEEITPLKRFGIAVDQLQAIILTRGERLQMMFDHIQQKYGSVVAYLRNSAGLHENNLSNLKQNFLTPPCSNPEGNLTETSK